MFFVFAFFWYPPRQPPVQLHRRLVQFGPGTVPEPHAAQGEPASRKQSLDAVYALLLAAVYVPVITSPLGS